MNAIAATKDGIEANFTARLDKFQRDVEASQANTSQEVLAKINKKAYHFKRKGNEAQFSFNTTVEDHIDAAKKTLIKMAPASEADKAALEKATAELDQGKEAIRIRQKHIRIADRSDWGVVAEYEADELADNSDDEKRLYKAKKERYSKKRRAALDNGVVRKRAKGEPARPMDVQPRPPPPPVKTRPLGPCYTCGEYGHLARSCAKSQRPYPFMNKSYDVCQNNEMRWSGSPTSGGDGLVQVISHLEGVDKAYRQEKFVDRASKHAPTQGVDNTKLENPTSDQVASLNKSSNPGECSSQGKGITCPSEAYWAPSEPDPYEASNVEFSRSWEAEEQGTTDQQVVDVQGRLRECIGFWTEVLQAPANVLDWIQNGYKLPLMYAPSPFEQCNHASAFNQQKFVTDTIKELLANRCIREVKEKPFICSPLSVVTNQEGKCRLVLNLRYLNQYLRKDNFKYEDIRIAMLLLNKNDFLLKFDLKSGYHHLDIYEPHQSYLGFAWEWNNAQSYFVFTVLPFGLSTACYAFTKLLRPLVGFWRGQGLRVVLYLDDGIVAVKGVDKANETSKKVQVDLASAGLIVNEQKSQWEPEQRLIWLGFEINLHEGQLFIPETKLTNTREY